MAIEDCDVFLCFRGKVRQSFTCHLSEALQRKKFRPFMDNENIDLGDKIDETISAIVILSNEFASSKHCLNELVLILERNRTSKYFVIPVFYYVETDDVKHQLGKFGAALKQLQKQHNDDKMEEWRAALSQIGGILGKEIKENNGLMENTIIKDIIATFEQKFTDHYPESLQQNQVMPAATTSNILNIAESSETPSEVEDTCDNNECGQQIPRFPPRDSPISIYKLRINELRPCIRSCRSYLNELGDELYSREGETREIFVFQTRKCGCTLETADNYFKSEKSYLTEKYRTNMKSGNAESGPEN